MQADSKPGTRSIRGTESELDAAFATLVGERTYGKSLVQQIVRLPSRAALKLTVARYLTPAGVDISRNGVQPDIRSQHALDAALRLFKSRR